MKFTYDHKLVKCILTDHPTDEAAYGPMDRRKDTYSDRVACAKLKITIRLISTEEASDW